jgi:chromosome segregation ATPase
MVKNVIEIRTAIEQANAKKEIANYKVDVARVEADRMTKELSDKRKKLKEFEAQKPEVETKEEFDERHAGLLANIEALKGDSNASNLKRIN